MTAQRLIDLFERFSGAASEVDRLRKFIMDLAVRGKLVSQDPQDTPVSDFLKHIGVHRASAGLGRPLKKSKAVEATARNSDFELPESWTWAAFGEIVVSRDGERIPVSREERDGREKIYDYYGASGVIDKIDNYLFDKPLLLIGEDGANLINRSTPIAFIARGKYWVNNHAHVIDGISEEFLQYLELFINSIDLTPYVTGTAQPKMNQAKMNSIPVALPPPEEQHRIVAKVNELMALCDQLEKARTDRETKRDKLTAATLARLNTPNPETFRNDARFALDNLQALTTRPDQIKQLRQTIVTLAMHGVLVTQDRRDEPVSELRNRVASALKAEGQRKRTLEDAELQTPHPVPSSWHWVQLGELCQLITKGSSPKWQGISYVDSGKGLAFVTSENVGNYALRKLDELKYVETRFRDIEPRSLLRCGDLLMNLVGASIGRTAVYDLDVEANINQAVALVRLHDILDGPDVRFLLHYLNSVTAVQLMMGSRVVTAQPNISLADVRGFPVPLPPLPEQKRIVAKIDELLSVCDAFELALNTGDSVRGRLLDALLSAALRTPLNPEGPGETQSDSPMAPQRRRVS